MRKKREGSQQGKFASGQIETMSSADNLIFQVDNRSSALVISGLLMFEHSLEYNLLKSVLQNRFVCHDRFRKRVQPPMFNVGRFRWEPDPHFDLHSHLHRIALPSPGDTGILRELIADLKATPIDYSKPLWQMYYIENIDGEKSALFARIHHSICDGITLVRILLGMTDANSRQSGYTEKIETGGEPLFTVPAFLDRMTGKIDRIKKRAERMAESLKTGISDPGDLVQRTRRAGESALDAINFTGKMLLLPAERETVLKGYPGVRKSVAWSDRIPLISIKSIGNHFQATVNDVLVSIVTGALRRCLRQSMKPVDDIEIRMAVPISFRASDQAIELGNRLSMILVELPVWIEDPAQRIREIKKRMEEIKREPDAAASYFLLNAAAAVPARLARTAAEIMADKVTGILSNVTGPGQAIYLAGERIENIVYWVPRPWSLGLGISLISFDGAVCIGVETDSGGACGSESIVDFIRSELDLLSGITKDEQPL